MTYDPGLVARIADLLPAAEIRTARQKNVFGGRGFLLGKSTFVIAWRDGLLVKVPRPEYEAALAQPGVTPFAPDGESPMSTWVVVPPDLIADDPDLIDWLTLAARSIR
ncbi:MAG TPA: TfoX/Sxy family protein [Gemmatimonadaceae bacterium]|nr:TfoX/Sxy family protein [Gemmatimonadaceae bacterium]